METFEALLEESTRVHGHICAGQVIGVRMSMLALRLLGLNDPKGKDRKKLYTIVEIDRCATDAIQSVTGCTLGKRSMKHVDHGVMAATFVNLETQQAVRVTALEESRTLSKKYCGSITDKYARQLEAYKIMPEEELFKVENVRVNVPEENLPGRPLSRVVCAKCGDWIQDRREVEREGAVLCRGCAGDKYYTVIDERDGR
ncbi:FmdE family protein [Desulforhopalus singaporensis]|uniref:Formylmethanofuran dehydrogenase, subunit E n=1 Tax=Desulforhopalus singaporensis TaxID=91360 RepID=A0A1H0QM55_9BACT|nr:FmdE family protein [Desulforhopalus singaporensis]SDP17806.1 formylmethanofuran dehydrogenase, subunit E [Desulforhopalus singaporensis]